MIQLGVSTACFYPLVTERAIEELAQLGVETIEIFYNSPSEYQPAYIKELKKMLEHYQMHAVSMHPYNSISEPFMFFTDYERRFQDVLEEYKVLFERMQIMGSKVFVFHGDRFDSSFPQKAYFERFAALSEAGRQAGIIVAQENVQRCRSREPAFIQDMKAYLGDRVHFVLDIKQAVRSRVDPFEMLDIMGGNLVHLHINDHDAMHDCLLPGKGCFDFALLSQKINELSYHGAALIEVYRQDFGEGKDILTSLAFLGKYF